MLFILTPIQSLVNFHKVVFIENRLNIVCKIYDGNGFFHVIVASVLSEE